MRLFFLIFLLLFALPERVHAADAVVTDLAVETDRGAARFAVDLSHRVTFHVFTLADPYRVVVDLPEVGWRLPAKPLPGEDGLFGRVRYGLFQPGNSRLVFDLTGPAELRDAYLLAPAGREPYRLVLDLAPTSRARYLEGVTQAPREVATVRRLRPPPLRADSRDARLRAVTDRVARVVAREPSPSVAPPVESLAEPKALAAVDPLPMPPRRPERRVRGPLPMIVIDPGHGGVDPGTHGPSGVYEKHIVLAIARELRRQIKATGRYRVALTRDRDVFIRLRDRVAIARAKNADLFVSVHADSIRNRSIAGASVYTLSERASDKEAAELAERENKADLIAGIDLSHESAEITNILIDLAQRETMNRSSRFANLLVGELDERIHLLQKPHRFAGFAVLKAPDLPSILLETGFLSNRHDERRLQDRNHRRRVAAALLAAIDRYFGSIEQAGVR